MVLCCETCKPRNGFQCLVIALNIIISTFVLSLEYSISRDSSPLSLVLVKKEKSSMLLWFLFLQKMQMPHWLHSLGNIKLHLVTGAIYVWFAHKLTRFKTVSYCTRYNSMKAKRKWTRLRPSSVTPIPVGIGRDWWDFRSNASPIPHNSGGVYHKRTRPKWVSSTFRLVILYHYSKQPWLLSSN